MVAISRLAFTTSSYSASSSGQTRASFQLGQHGLLLGHRRCPPGGGDPFQVRAVVVNRHRDSFG